MAFHLPARLQWCYVPFLGRRPNSLLSGYTSTLKHQRPVTFVRCWRSVGIVCLLLLSSLPVFWLTNTNTWTVLLGVGNTLFYSCGHFAAYIMTAAREMFSIVGWEDTADIRYEFTSVWQQPPDVFGTARSFKGKQARTFSCNEWKESSEAVFVMGCVD